VKSAPPAPAAPTRRTAAGVGGRGFPSSDDYYPDASRRLEEQGVVTVHSCIDGSGKLTEEPSVTKSSGSNRLDGGALKLAKAASGKYTPATEDGKGVPACINFNVKFQLR